VIIPDLNLLLYAEIDAHPLHDRARRWWEDALTNGLPLGLAPVCVFGFLRIATNRRVYAAPLPVGDAIGRVSAWLERPHVTMLVPGRDHVEIALRLLQAAGTAGNLTTDVQIAAHAVELNAEVYSNDADFGRFDGVRRFNPLK
jgi:uncharacterized protein